MSEIKLCKDCKWFKPALEFYTLQQMAYNQSIDGIRMVAPQPRGVDLRRDILKRIERDEGLDVANDIKAEIRRIWDERK